MKKTSLPVSLIIICFLIWWSGCSHNEQPPYTDNELLLGTFVKITSYDSIPDRAVVRGAVDSAFRMMRTVENHTNPFDPQTEIAKLNARASRQSVFSLSPLLTAVMDSALNISRRTTGAYDPTLWPVFRLWHFGTDTAAVPSQDSMKKYLTLVDYRFLKLDGSHIRLNRTGLGIDLSGISKGFAVEKAREVMLSFGLQNFIIDAGGNLGIEWHSRQPVEIYIRHPRKNGAFFGKFPVQKKCGIATSGDYQNYFMQDSVVYHHILNPQTGMPARNAVSVTVLAPDATTADALSTALFVKGPDRAMKYVENTSELEAVIILAVKDSLSYRVSSGLKEKFVRINQDEKSVLQNVK